MNAPLHTAIAQHLTHGAAAQTDPGTDSLVDQALAHSRPAPLDEGGTRLFGPVHYVGDEPAEMVDDHDFTVDALIFGIGVAVGVAGSWLWPMGWAPALGG